MSFGFWGELSPKGGVIISQIRTCSHWPIHTCIPEARADKKLHLFLQSRTVVKRGSFGKADEVRATLWGQRHAAIGHRFRLWKDVTWKLFLLADGSQRGHQGRQGLGDVTVVHIRLIDLKLLSCGAKQIRFKANAANGTSGSLCLLSTENK